MLVFVFVLVLVYFLDVCLVLVQFLLSWCCFLLCLGACICLGAGFVVSWCLSWAKVLVLPVLVFGCWFFVMFLALVCCFGAGIVVLVLFLIHLVVF